LADGTTPDAGSQGSWRSRAWNSMMRSDVLGCIAIQEKSP